MARYIPPWSALCSSWEQNAICRRFVSKTSRKTGNSCGRREAGWRRGRGGGGEKQLVVLQDQRGEVLIGTQPLRHAGEDQAKRGQKKK